MAIGADKSLHACIIASRRSFRVIGINFPSAQFFQGKILRNGLFIRPLAAKLSGLEKCFLDPRITAFICLNFHAEPQRTQSVYIIKKITFANLAHLREITIGSLSTNFKKPEPENCIPWLSKEILSRSIF